MAVDNIVYKVVALTVFILITATVLIPVIQDAQDNQRITANNTSELFNAVDSSGTNSITIGLVGGVPKVNDYNVTGAVDVLISDDLIVFYSSGFKVIDFNNDYLGGVTGDITVINDEYSYMKADGVTEVTGTITGTFLYLSENGKYGQFAYNADFRYNDDSEIYAVVITSNIGYSLLSGVMHGSVKDGFTNSSFNFDTDNGTYVDVSNTISANIIGSKSSYGYYDFVKSELISNVGGVDYDGQYNHIYAPVQYTLYDEDALSQVNLLNIIPLMVIIAAIMLAVAMLKGRS